MAPEVLDPPLNYNGRGRQIEYCKELQTVGNVVIETRLNGLWLEARDFGKILVGRTF